MKNRRSLLFALAALACAPAFAQADFPNRPVKLITLSTAGGALDVLARLIADEISRNVGQQVFVENRVGAGGNLGAEATAKSPPDGYTTGMVTVATHGINPTLYGDLIRFDAVKDFSPIILASRCSTCPIAARPPQCPTCRRGAFN